jgi:hypothetical protein
MDYFYPDRIFEDDFDDEASSCHSREIEGVSAVKSVAGVMKGDSGHDDKCSDSQTVTHQENLTRYARDDDAGSNNQREQNSYAMAAMIQHERNRRLGVREDKESTHSNEILPPDPTFPERVFGNIRGWFGGGGGSAMMANENASPSIHSTRRDYGNEQDDHVPEKLQLTKHVSHIDDSSSSISSTESSSGDNSSASSNTSHSSDADFTPQERAREQALRYLCNSCVESGRKSKSSSYVWGLERLDLTRKRDRLAKELQIVESEMNKDHGLTDHSRDGDPISYMAETLLRELPRIQSVDAGAGIDLVDVRCVNSCFMTWEEYADISNSDDNHRPSAWNNKEAVDVYIDSLQRRLREAVDQTRSLEKRLVVLENAGDDIVCSLCEDLAEITEYSYKTEARYIKKGKELQRKRRRQELRHRVKMKQAEHRVRNLEAQLIIASGNTQSNEHITLNPAEVFEGNDSSTDDSTNSEIEDDNEVLLERNLSILRSKYEQEKQNHISELELIRRQCEQLKLHLSVARLVMEGDDNLYEYIALLERCDLSLRRRRKEGGGVFDNRDSETGDIIPSPPTNITRARAKLLKVVHLERIYEQRLVVSKAFTDATIKALDQELVERHKLSRDIEVRCLNELVAIDAEIKDAHQAAIEKLAMIERETHELQNAISACIVQNPTACQSLLFGSHDARVSSIDKLLEGEKLSSNKRLSRRDCLFQPKQSTENGPSADVVFETGGTVSMSDDPSFPLNDRDEQEKHVIKSNGNFDRLNDSSLPIKDKLPEINKQRISSLVETPGSVDVETTSSSRFEIHSDESVALDNASLKQLGCDLKFTLARYQKSYHASTSRDRVEQLDNMNDLVIKIAKLLGPNNEFDYPGVSELTSWSFKKTRNPPLDDEYRRTTKKTKRRNQVRDKECGQAMKDRSKQSVK